MSSTPTDTLHLRGLELGPATPPVTHEVKLTSARRVQPGAGARDAAAAPIAVQRDEVVRVEFDNGIKLWMRADDLVRERGRSSGTRGARVRAPGRRRASTA